MILCLLIAFIGSAFAVAYIGVSSMGAGWFSGSPTMTAMNTTTWAMAGNSWSGMGIATIFVVGIVGSILLFVIYLLLPRTEKEPKT